MDSGPPRQLMNLNSATRRSVSRSNGRLVFARAQREVLDMLIVLQNMRRETEFKVVAIAGHRVLGLQFVI